MESTTEFYRGQFLQMDKQERRRKIKLDIKTIQQNMALLKWLRRELAWKKSHLAKPQPKHQATP